MENLSEELKVADMKKAGLGKLVDEIHAQCNTVLLFTLQWKDLESHFESMRASLLEQAEDLAIQEKQVAEAGDKVRVKEIEVEFDRKEVKEFLKEMKDKEDELGSLHQRFMGCQYELQGKERQLGSVQNQIRVCTDDLQGKQRDLGILQKRMDEVREEIGRKEAELDLVNKSVEENCKKLKWREKEVEEVLKMFSDCTSKLQLKHKELNEVKELIRSYNAECTSEERRLADLEKRSRDCRVELGLNEKELGGVRTSIEECLKELGWRKEELERTRKLVDEQRHKLHSKTSEVESIKEMIEEFNEELEKKELEYSDKIRSLKVKDKEVESLDETLRKCSKRVKQCNEELESKTRDLDRTKEKLAACVKNLELKQAELSDVRSSIASRSNSLSTKEKLIEELQSQIDKLDEKLEKGRERKLLSMQQALFEEFSLAALECNNTSVGVGEEHLRKCVMKLESRLEQLSSIRSKLFECHRRLIAKEQYVDSIKQKQERHIEQLNLKEEELNTNRKRLEQRCAAVEEIKKQLENNIADAFLRSSASVESSVQEENGRNLQCLLNEHFRRQDLLLSEVWTALLKSPDPAKLVLNSMSGFYPQESSDEYELSIVRKSCIALLELLSRIPTQMKRQMSEESVAVAKDWKKKLGAAPANSLEVLGLVKLASAFRFPPAFKNSLLNDVKPNMKELAYAENLVGSFILSPTVSVDRLGNPVHPSSEGLISNTTSDEGSYPQLLLDEPKPSELSPDEVTNWLRNSLSDPAAMVFDFIRDSLLQQGSESIKQCDERALKTQALILQQLMILRPFISPDVKGEATKLAVTWRGSLRMWVMDILVFLLFVATYRVAAHFELEDVVKLAGMIAHYKRAPQLCAALGLEAQVPGLIRSLMKKGRNMEAVRFSCAFRLVEDYPPHLLVMKFLEEKRTFESGKFLLESQCEAFNEHMNFLKELIHRVQELNFDTSLVNSKLVEHFQDLARLLEQQKCSLLSLAACVPQSLPPGFEYRNHGATSAVLTGYRVDPRDQVLAGAVLPSYRVDPRDQVLAAATFSPQQQHSNWPWQAADLTHPKRPRTGMQ